MKTFKLIKNGKEEDLILEDMYLEDATIELYDLLDSDYTVITPEGTVMTEDNIENIIDYYFL